MKDIDRIYQLFTEANPAPADTAPTTERPDADVILNEQRNPTMLTKEPRTIESQPAPVRLRRWRGPAIALGTFVGAAMLGVAAWLVVANGDSDVADGSTLPPTTLPPVTTTTLPDVVVPGVVSVPNLSGLTLAEAKGLMSDAGLEIVALPGGQRRRHRHGPGASSRGRGRRRHGCHRRRASRSRRAIRPIPSPRALDK